MKGPGLIFVLPFLEKVTRTIYSEQCYNIQWYTVCIVFLEIIVGLEKYWIFRHQRYINTISVNAAHKIFLLHSPAAAHVGE